VAHLLAGDNLAFDQSLFYEQGSVADVAPFEPEYFFGDA
jgi:hypothetical protein